MAIMVSITSRRLVVALIAGLVSIATLGLLLVSAGSASATVPQCMQNIAGTYYSPSDYITTFYKDGSLVGQYSRTDQEGAVGLGESFSGKWRCSGSTITLEQFRFDESNSQRQFERGEGTGTFDGHSKLTLNYNFYVYPETATASQVRANNSPITITGVVIQRVSSM